jgi:heme/copper-type cytochrome/quinol oxidase subunit 4
MRHHFRLVAILSVCLVAYGVLLVAFHWINQPRDSAVFAGISLILALLLIVPLVIRTIWRRL